MSKKETVVRGLRATGRGIKKVGSKTFQGVKVAAPSVGKVAVGVGSAVAASQTVKSFKNKGLILFIASWTIFIITKIFGVSSIYSWLSLIFMIYASITIFEKKGLLIVVTFIVWYFIYNAPGISTLRYYLLSIILLVLVLHGLINTFSKKKSFSFTLRDDALYGFGVILIFFLDIGAVEFIKDLGITLPSLLVSIVTNIPLWAYVGLYVMISEEETKTWLTKLLSFAAIVYIVVIIVVPVAVSDAESVLPGTSDLLKAKEAAEKQIPKGENPFVSNLLCILSDPTDVQNCVKKRQEVKQIESICKDTKNLKEGTDAYKSCIKEETEKSEKAKLQISGTIDTSVKEPTKAEFKISEYFPKLSYQLKYPYPAQLEIKNPREQDLDFEISCFFKKDAKTITGTANPSKFKITEKEKMKSITCTPQEDLNGSYKLTLQANVLNLKTESHLTRLFIGDVSKKTKAEVDKLTSLFVPGKKYLSQAPDEFARLNFGFGEPETNPIIDSDDTPLFVSTIENVARGKILKIKKYYVDLGDEMITAQSDCFSGPDKEISLPTTKTTYKIPLKSCFVTLPSDLKNPEDFEVKTFNGYLEYDYQIEKEINIEVKDTG